MSTFHENLEKYAALAVEVGVNVQKGQTLVVTSSISSAEFVRLIVKKAYAQGAKNVIVDWTDEVVTRTKYEMAPDEAFLEFPMWHAKGWEEMAADNAAFLNVISNDPDLLKGIDSTRIANANKTRSAAMQPFRTYMMSDKVSWSIVAVPSSAWAAKVFPNVPEDKQVDALWDAIFSATRVNLDNPVDAWKTHTETLDSKATVLNNKKYKSIHYTADGTDLTVDLPEGHIWVSAGSENAQGTIFVANIPTEEVFTAPSRNGVNGVVRSTKPLSYSGNLINDFSLTFKDGRIIDYTADQGYETLKQLIETDEGSHYLGEVALVPHNSPISNTNIIFFNTLFDENASNHLAIGNGYAFCLEGGKSMAEEELISHGINKSLTHVDFMIGSSDMDIDGITKDGTREPIFRNGNWAF